MLLRIYVKQRLDCCPYSLQLESDLDMPAHNDCPSLWLLLRLLVGWWSIQYPLSYARIRTRARKFEPVESEPSLSPYTAALDGCVCRHTES